MSKPEQRCLFASLIAWIAASACLPSTILLASTLVHDPEYVITRWTTQDGLPESSATSAVQTPEGYLWFGTFNGLVRFDGVKFTVFNPTNTPALLHPGILHLHLHPKTGLWINTFRGFSRLRNREWQSYPENVIYANRFVACPGQSPYALVSGQALFRLEASGLVRIPLPQTVSVDAVPLVVCDAKGTLYLGSGPELYRWLGDRWQPLSISKEVQSALSRGRYIALARDGTWLLTGDMGLVTLTPEKVLRVMDVPLREIFDIHEDPDGTLWLSSSSDGLLRITKAGAIRLFNKQTGFPSNSLRFTIRDREGNLWVGTNGDGLLRLRKRTVTTFGTESGLPDFPIKSVAIDDRDAVLVASYGGGVHKLVNGKASAAFAGPLLPAHSQSLLFDRSKRLWVGSFGDGLWRSNGNNLERIPDAHSGSRTIQALFEDSKGRIWIGGSTRVALFEAGKFRPIPIENGKAPVPIAAFAESPDTGRIWAGGDGGLYSFNGASFTPVPRAKGTPFPAIRAIEAGTSASLRLGSLDEGLLSFTPPSAIAKLSPLTIPPSIGEIFPNGSLLWLATNRGIWSIPRSDTLSPSGLRHWRGFGAAEGMTSFECSVGRQPLMAKDRRGALWVATLKGVARIDPAEVPVETFSAGVIIEEVSYSQGNASEVLLAVDGKARIELPPDCWNIRIAFTSPHLSSPEKVNFQYTLSNSLVGRLATGADLNREIRVLTIPAGDNHLVLRARNASGEWSEHSTHFVLHRKPRLWENPLLLSAALLLSTGLLAFAVYYVSRVRTRRHNQELHQSRAAEESMLLAKQKAEEASRLKSLFLANMSHELRTPMNGILGMTQLLQMTRLDAEQVEMLETLHASGASLMRLLNEILDLTRIEAGRLELKTSPINLRSAVRDAVELVQPLASRKQIALSWTVDDSIPLDVQADSLRLRQIFLNYLDNAIKFTETGAVTLRIEDAGGADGRIHLRIVVEDTGCGIPADKLTEIFNVFTQVDSSSTRRHTGSGLGLTIVKRLSSLMNGDAGATSTLGEGSSFWATIVLEPALGQKPETAETFDTPQFAKAPRVLVAEDNRVNQLVMSNLLRKMGCTVAVAGNGEEAVEMITSNEFDLVFMDVQMPRIDGLEASRRIRESETGLKHTPIVAVSASVRAEDRERCVASGMDDFIAKPITIQDIAAALTRHIPSGDSNA